MGDVEEVPLKTPLTRLIVPPPCNVAEDPAMKIEPVEVPVPAVRVPAFRRLKRFRVPDEEVLTISPASICRDVTVTVEPASKATLDATPDWPSTTTAYVEPDGVPLLGTAPVDH